jgi:hypothetical protein
MTELVAMPQERPNEGRRAALYITFGMVAIVILAACCGVYLAASSDPATSAVASRAAAPTTATAGHEVPRAAPDPDDAYTAQFVGRKACSECHPGEAALHARSGHAQTLRSSPVGAILSWLNGRSVKDREYPDAVWTYSVSAGGKLEIERTERGESACYPVDYALGSGTNGVTFVSLAYAMGDVTHPTGLEHRLSYFANGPKMDISPGQAKEDLAIGGRSVEPHGRVLNNVALENCLHCHSTNTSKQSAGDVGLSHLVPNVSCEKCHGPGRAHIEAARRGDLELKMPFGADDATPMRQAQLCGECHRRLESISPSQATPQNAEIARFQPVGLALSRCFDDGRSGLACGSCHDPHSRVSRDRSAYEAVCMNCHSMVLQRSCPVSARGKCIDCHMPRRTVSVEFQFTDHWIRKPAPEAKQKVKH